MRRLFFALLLAGFLAAIGVSSLVAAVPSGAATAEFRTIAPGAHVANPYPTPDPSPQRTERYLPLIQNGRPVPTPTPTPKPTQMPYPTPRP